MINDNYNEHFDETTLSNIAQYFDKFMNSPVSSASDQEILHEKLDLPRQNTIKMDCHRTRSTNFQEQIKLEMELILTHFCKKYQIEYKQGLNEILAPFILFTKVGLSLSKCFALFECFFNKFCLNFYHDSNFTSLQIFFKMVSIVLKYHDPALARYLQNHEIEPQIFCISFLMTIFSSKLSLKLTYDLWLLMVSERDDFLLLFIVVGIMLSRKNEIMESKKGSIFTTITNMIFKNEEEMLEVIKISFILRKTTPASFILFFKRRNIFTPHTSTNDIRQLLNNIDKFNLFLLLPDEIFIERHYLYGLCQQDSCNFCLPKRNFNHSAILPQIQHSLPTVFQMIQMSIDIRNMNYQMNFIIIDLRKQEKNKSKKSLGIEEDANIYQIKTNSLLQQIQANFLQEFIEAKGKQHFLFLLSNFSFERIYGEQQKIEQKDSQEYHIAKKLINCLNSASFPYLSILEGGEKSYIDFEKEQQHSLQLKRKKSQEMQEFIPLQKEERSLEDRIFQKKQPFKLKLSEIFELSEQFYAKKVHAYCGFESSKQLMLFIFQKHVFLMKWDRELERLVNFVSHSFSILEHIISSQRITDITMTIVQAYKVRDIYKISVKRHKNNAIVLYYHPFTKSKSESEEKEKEKVTFELENIETLKECSTNIKNIYVSVIKAEKNKKQMDEFVGSEMGSIPSQPKF